MEKKKSKQTKPTFTGENTLTSIQITFGLYTQSKRLRVPVLSVMRAPVVRCLRWAFLSDQQTLASALALCALIIMFSGYFARYPMPAAAAGLVRIKM